MKISAYDRLGRRKYLNAEENQRFMRAAQVMPPLEEALCRTLYFTGCRLSEGLSLGPDSLDCSENVLQIRTLKKRGEVHTRRIPIPVELARSLREINCDGERFWWFSRTTAWRIVRAVMMLAEIEGVHACPKGLRHGFGVRTALAGVPITKIKDWMGHSKVETTSIYLDVQDAEERELMQRTWGEVL